MTFPEQSTASIGWNPSIDDRILLAGDEFDLELIRTALASLPAKARGQVFIEVQSVEDVATLDAPGRFSICWLVRDRGQELRRSVDAWLSEMLPAGADNYGADNYGGVADPAVYAWITHQGAARTLTSN